MSNQSESSFPSPGCSGIGEPEVVVSASPLPLVVSSVTEAGSVSVVVSDDVSDDVSVDGEGDMDVVEGIGDE